MLPIVINTRGIQVALAVLMLLGSSLTWDPGMVYAARKSEVKLDLKNTQAISINEAQVADLQGVKGIGPELARRIVAYRDEHGPFSEMEDLTAVRGIGQAKLQKIKNQISL